MIPTRTPFINLRGQGTGSVVLKVMCVCCESWCSIYISCKTIVGKPWGNFASHIHVDNHMHYPKPFGLFPKSTAAVIKIKMPNTSRKTKKILSNITWNPLKNLPKSSQNGAWDPPKTQCQALCPYFGIFDQSWSDLGRPFEVIWPPKSIQKYVTFNVDVRTNFSWLLNTFTPIVHVFWASKLELKIDRCLSRKMVFRVHETPNFSGLGVSGTITNLIKINNKTNMRF